jgi:hypothetical protein
MAIERTSYRPVQLQRTGSDSLVTVVPRLGAGQPVNWVSIRGIEILLLTQSPDSLRIPTINQIRQ